MLHIDIAIGLDVNVGKNINLKYDNYMQLLSELKRLYPSFTFKIIPIVLGVIGLLSGLQKNKEKIGVKNIKDTILKCQRMALLGTVKIVKSVLKMKNIWRIQFVWLVTTYSEAEPQGRLGWSTLSQLSTTFSSWLLLREARL